MKKFSIIVIALFLSFTNSMFAQSEQGLKVQGKSQMMVKADIAVINFMLEGKDIKFDMAVDKLNDKINLLNKILKKKDIDRSKISASNYQIRKEYNHDYQRGTKEFKGYRASYDVSVELPASTKILNSVFKEIFKEFSDLELRMNFALSNREKYEKELLKLAVQNAKEKAMTIAEASNVKLGKIKTIQYMNGNPPVGVYANEQADVVMMRKSSVSTVDDFKPGKITLSDNIFVIWNIN